MMLDRWMNVKPSAFGERTICITVWRLAHGPAKVDGGRSLHPRGLDPHAVGAHVVDESCDRRLLPQLWMRERQLDRHAARDLAGVEGGADLGKGMPVGEDGLGLHEMKPTVSVRVCQPLVPSRDRAAFFCSGHGLMCRSNPCAAAVSPTTCSRTWSMYQSFTSAAV